MSPKAGLSFTALLIWCLSIGWMMYRIHNELPEPRHVDFDKDGNPAFNEGRARELVERLSTGSYAYRIVGTHALAASEDHLYNLLHEMKSALEISELNTLHHMEVWMQQDSGSHLFHIANKGVWKKYYGIRNVVVRLSSRKEASKENAILFNAHLDSTLPSPGAADDLSGISVMVEAIRVMINTKQELQNAAVFLFNGGEESLQDASHMFITKHELRHTIKAVVNLEAAGTTGKEIVFQATSEAMIRAYGTVPYPYGTVLATEIFATGVIVSDTDFIQFQQYGNLTGLDMALVQNSYLYHTRRDTIDQLQHGSLQHMGENTLALLKHLTLTPSALTNIEPTRNTVFFTAFGSRFFPIYSTSVALQIYGTIFAVTAGLVLQRAVKDGFQPYLIALCGHFLGLLGCLISSNAFAFFVASILDKSLTWYRHIFLPILLFAPPAVLGLLTSALITKTFSSTTLEVHTIMTSTFVNAFLGFAGQAAGLGSSYLFAVGAGWLLINVLVMESLNSNEMPLFLHFTSLFLPLSLGSEGLYSFLDLFVPLGARMGADAPADHILASLVALMVFLASPTFPAFCHRYSRATLKQAATVLLVASLAISFLFARPGWRPFDPLHPKRFMSIHLENITASPPQKYLHLATVDRAPGFVDMLENVLEKADINSTLLHHLPIDENVPDWDVIYPISQFLKTYRVSLPTERFYKSRWSNLFKVTAKDVKLNAVTQRRTMTILIKHPGLIWTNIAFHGQVVEWDLPVLPAADQRRHHVKSISGRGIEEWSLTLTLQLNDAEFRSALEHAQIAKGQRQGDPSLPPGLGLRVDFSGLDAEGLYAANLHRYEAGKTASMDFFQNLEKHLPDYVDPMLLTVISGQVIL